VLAAIVLRRVFFIVPLLALGVAVASGYFAHRQVVQQREGARVLERSFYGTLRTEDVGWTRQLVNGVILHGEQSLLEGHSRDATTYYGPTSGIGIALTLKPAVGRRVGVIGLGTGSIAAYGRKGDVFRFYDLNPQVVQLARTEFTYLRDCPCTVEVALGDARLSLEREPSQQFDVLAIDAFASDAIPVHLMTVEAVGVYLRHMKPGGVIAFHVTNRFFDLAPAVDQLAKTYGLASALVVDDTPAGGLSKSDWMLLSTDQGWLAEVAVLGTVQAPTAIPSLHPWTDGYSNLLRILK
jgi:SAM-dependent methyltransferase